MLNQIVLVGRLTKDPQPVELNRKVGLLNLAIPRCYKNSEGEYETDFIEVEVNSTMAQNTCEYCRKGDIISVKGRLETYSVDNGDNINYKTKVVAEKITFLSSNHS